MAYTILKIATLYISYPINESWYVVSSVSSLCDSQHSSSHFYKQCVFLYKLFPFLEVIMRRFLSFQMTYFSIHVQHSEFHFPWNYSLKDKCFHHLFYYTFFSPPCFRVLCFLALFKRVNLVSLQNTAAWKKPSTSYCNKSKRTCVELSVQNHFRV